MQHRNQSQGNQRGQGRNNQQGRRRTSQDQGRSYQGEQFSRGRDRNGRGSDEYFGGDYENPSNRNFEEQQENMGGFDRGRGMSSGRSPWMHNEGQSRDRSMYGRASQWNQSNDEDYGSRDGWQEESDSSFIGTPGYGRSQQGMQQRGFRGTSQGGQQGSYRGESAFSENGFETEGSLRSPQGWQRQSERGNQFAESQSSQHRGKGPKSFKRSDDRLMEEICQQLEDNDELDATNIDVRVTNGEVTLSGTVESRRDKRLADEIAEGVRGVKDIKNEITLESQSKNEQGEASTNKKHVKVA